ncbi:UNVERIFIED_ORG: hypothetical protein BCL66_102187 [Martelella mediterranea]
MSRIVEEAERKREWEEYCAFLQQLLDGDDIQDADAEGVTRQVIGEGLGSLTPAQRYVFKHGVEEKFPQPVCEQCGETIPWSEAYGHIHGQGLCSSCQHSYDRFMEER